MTPDLSVSMTRSTFGTNDLYVPHLVWNRAKDNSLDNRAKQVLAVLVLVLAGVGAFPLATAVHGQQPRTELEYEAQDARDRLSKIEATMANLPVLIAAMAEHQKLEDQISEERFKHEQEFENRVLYGLLGLGGSAILAILGWVLGHFVTIELPGGRRKRTTV